MKKVIIYLQETDNVDEIIYEMKKYIYLNGWKLYGGYVDLIGESEQLEKLINILNKVDTVLIYNKANLRNEFNIELLIKSAQLENVNIVEYSKESNDKIHINSRSH